MSISFNNYTVTDTVVGPFEGGENVSSIYQSAILTLSPNPGYTLDASSFSLGEIYNEIQYAEFVQDGPNIICFLYFRAEFIMPASNVDIPLCILGSAELTQYVVEGYVAHEEFGYWEYSSEYNAFPIQGNYNITELGWQGVVSADSGYYFSTPPSIVQTNGDYDIFNIIYNDIFDINGNLITRGITIQCTIPNYNSLDNYFYVTASTEEIYVPLEGISSYIIDDSPVSLAGEVRLMQVYGTPGATWNFVTPDGSILQVGVQDPVTGVITYGTSTSGVIPASGVSSFYVSIPETDGSASYEIMLNAVFLPSFNQPDYVILNQYGPITIFYDTTDSSIFSNDGTFQNTGQALSVPLFGMNGFSNSFLWNITSAPAFNCDIILIEQPDINDFSNIDASLNGGSDFGFGTIVATQTASNNIEIELKGGVSRYGTEYVISELSLSSFIANIDTIDPDSISDNQADTGCIVTSASSTEIIDYKGVCYSEATLPTVADNVSSTSTGSGTYFATISGLTPGTTYYVRAFAYNLTGNVFYGPEKSFTTTISLIDMNLVQTCSGTDVTNVGVNSITGGVLPYYAANTYFTDEASALANTSWSSTPNGGLIPFDYAVPGFGTYWIAVKDSAGTVFAKGFYADCWDSISATRSSAFLSANSYFNSIGACGSGSTQNIYIAYRNPGILSNGDRVFTTASGNTPFNGMIVSELDNWWKFDDPGTLSACTTGTTMRIDNSGFIDNVTCCP